MIPTVMLMIGVVPCVLIVLLARFEDLYLSNKRREKGYDQRIMLGYSGNRYDRNLSEFRKRYL